MKLFNHWTRALAVVCWGVVANAQPNDEFFEYFDEPMLLWENVTTDSASGLGVQAGNGLYMSPDNDMLVSTSADGTVRAFDPLSGEILWTYTPESFGLPVQCFGGVTFSVNGPRPYIVYAVADGADPANSNQDADT